MGTRHRPPGSLGMGIGCQRGVPKPRVASPCSQYWRVPKCVCLLGWTVPCWGALGCFELYRGALGCTGVRQEAVVRLR